MTPIGPCPHACCEDPDGPYHEHDPHRSAETCPDCAALTVPVHPLEQRALEIAEKKQRLAEEKNP